MGLEDFVGSEALEELYRPPGEARGLPGMVYGEAFYELENRLLFPRSWAAVGVGGEIPEPGDAVPVMLGDWPLFLVRDLEGRVRAFHNVCRHRGMRVIPEPCRGRRHLSCPWHAWTYDLNGRLVTTPDIGGPGVHEVAGFDRDESPLEAVRVAEWHDLIFVNIDGNAPAFEEHRKPVDELLAAYDLSKLRFANKWVHTYECNWKMAIEGGMEDYHVRWIHPQVWQGGAPVSTRWECQEGVYGAVFSEQESTELFMGPAGPEAPLHNGNRPLPSVLKRARDGTAGSYLVNIFPNEILVVLDNYALWVNFMPDGSERTHVVMNHYYMGDAAFAPAFAEQRDAALGQWQYLMAQDNECFHLAHANARMRDRAGLRTRFSPFWEGAVQQFQKMVVETLREGEAANR